MHDFNIFEFITPLLLELKILQYFLQLREKISIRLNRLLVELWNMEYGSPVGLIYTRSSYDNEMRGFGLGIRIIG